MTKKTAQSSMSTKLVTISFNASMETAYQRMKKKRLRHLPVCDDNGEVIGMLSDRDVQRAMISDVTREKPSNISSETISFDPAAKVRDYMGWPVISVAQNTDLRVVAERMLSEKVSALLVEKGQTTVGIITTDDLIKVLVDLLSDPKTPARWTLQSVLEGANHDISDAIE